MASKTIVGRTIRYGTVFTPTVTNGVLSRFPAKLSDPKPGGSHDFSGATIMVDQKFQLTISTIQGENCPASRLNLKGGAIRYPSVSAILGCIEGKDQLYWWQRKMISQMGLEGFKKYMKERMDIGIGFHKMASKFLDRAKKGDPMTDSEVLDQLEDGPLKGYVTSVLPILKDLTHFDEAKFEQWVSHHGLCYYGRYDAILKYKDTMFLFDWKTASAGSTKTKTSDLASMYSDPIQIAAYMGAYNSEKPKAKVTYGAIAVAYECGSTGNVVEMGSKDVEEYWQKWTSKLHQFYFISNSTPAEQELSFVYDGMADASKKNSVDVDEKEIAKMAK